MRNNIKIAILGGRGIPNEYGGFEQFAEYLSIGLVNKGNKVTVYSPGFHSYNKSTYCGVDIIYKWCPENTIGSAAHFIYDYICLKDALKRGFDIILELGYQSASISYYLCDIRKSIIITNMDGLEWKRDKWSFFVKKITILFERIGASRSDYLVADNKGIMQYLREKYAKDSFMIPYGAKIFKNPDIGILKKYDLRQYSYYMIIARLEPENNIEMILDGYVDSGSNERFIVIGNHQTKYGSYLKERYKDTMVDFIGGVYNIDELNNLRYFSKVYFHGHSVGGTNPSLLEAMASSAFIYAHNNIFNMSVLGDNAYYFTSKEDVCRLLIEYPDMHITREVKIQSNLRNISQVYNWDIIVDQYIELFQKALNENSHNHSR